MPNTFPGKAIIKITDCRNPYNGMNAPNLIIYDTKHSFVHSEEIATVLLIK